MMILTQFSPRRSRFQAALLPAVFSLALLAPLAGCKLIAAPFLMWGEEQTKKIPAEFPHLQGKKVCVVVWADMNTLFEYPYVRLELSEHIAYAMQNTIKGISFVPNRQVVDYQHNNADWDKAHPAALGRRFDADRVLLVELSQYTMREPDSPHLYRGRISANVKVYDANEPGAEPLYKTQIETVFPPDSVGKYGTNENSVRLSAMQVFGNDLANKFYERQVKAKDVK